MLTRRVLEEMREKLAGRTPVTRFAPSPTGYLHLGHVVNALHVWGIAHAAGGQVILRLENHDRTRCKPAYEEAILQDLEWLGLEPDLGKPSEFRSGRTEYRQSDCEEHYRHALEVLRSQGLVYACDCSRKSIQARTHRLEAGELYYDGCCRDRRLEEAPGRTLRMRMPDGAVEFDDLLQSRQIQCPAREIGDMPLRDNHGNWTYQFAVVVDDIRQGVNLVIRGMDILSSTARQMMLARSLLGREWRPLYLHHPLLVDAAGRKLSKRDFDADIRSMREGGAHRDLVLQTAADLGGLVLDAAQLHAGQITLRL